MLLTVIVTDISTTCAVDTVNNSPIQDHAYRAIMLNILTYYVKNAIITATFSFIFT